MKKLRLLSFLALGAASMSALVGCNSNAESSNPDKDIAKDGKREA